MKYLTYLVVASLSFFMNVSVASEDSKHSQEDKKNSNVSSSKDDHSKEGSDHNGEKDNHGEEHADHKEGEEHEEENSQVGLDKGIIAADKKNGFKLSPEAEKNFGIGKVKVKNILQIEIPKTAIVTSGMEINLYRMREGFYKRIDFKIKSNAQNNVTITSNELVVNDEIAISGLGFLRISELAAFDGAPEGHSH